MLEEQEPHRERAGTTHSNNGLDAGRGLLLAFSLLIYVGGETLLNRYVDRRLLELADTLDGSLSSARADPQCRRRARRVRPKRTEPGGGRHDCARPHIRRLLSVDGQVWKGSDVVPRPPVLVLLTRWRAADAFDLGALAGLVAYSARVYSLPRKRGGIRYTLQAGVNLFTTRRRPCGLDSADDRFRCHHADRLGCSSV